MPSKYRVLKVTGSQYYGNYYLAQKKVFFFWTNLPSNSPVSWESFAEAKKCITQDKLSTGHISSEVIHEE